MDFKLKTVPKRKLLSREISLMMFGFGDVRQPAPDSVGVMEDILIDYLTEMCFQASRWGGKRGKVTVQDFKLALRHDQKKLARVEELLKMAEVIKESRRLFSDDEEEPKE
ncbi:hypothetical protein H4R33_001624 [Dimargaris cristalligena]|uniref:Transcription initiation factor TFIID subunit 13 n=1 Tax=Dimargaris cristalligena TaxID=215637 RepID=A0A4P9ZXJ0_9FUNG|nr:hypothetical protein H4R33_001624 [Dimargaris cristalligena]RKP37622.1 transcription initiation factor IID, 18kDa subunit [Dimargaris cristalligena]|eukprot:RKP37622.1 transcription initiation factor IID, 18kDa subunit [Dimargaris cristalligena]